MANDKKNPDVNRSSSPSPKPDSDMGKNPTGNTGPKGNTGFGSSNRNDGRDLNNDSKKPNRAGFDISNRDADPDRSQNDKMDENEVSGGSSSTRSPGINRNH